MLAYATPPLTNFGVSCGPATTVDEPAALPLVVIPSEAEGPAVRLDPSPIPRKPYRWFNNRTVSRNTSPTIVKLFALSLSIVSCGVCQNAF
jgi:hypothetical protein